LIIIGFQTPAFPGQKTGLKIEIGATFKVVRRVSKVIDSVNVTFLQVDLNGVGWVFDRTPVRSDTRIRN
jgi:hypothetical protein